MLVGFDVEVGLVAGTVVMVVAQPEIKKAIDRAVNKVKGLGIM